MIKSISSGGGNTNRISTTLGGGISYVKQTNNYDNEPNNTGIKVTGLLLLSVIINIKEGGSATNNYVTNTYQRR